MDPRQSQHPFNRPADRPLIHNPNHQSAPPPQQPQSYSGYPTPVSQPQPPVHVPFSDPYTSSRRDPFLPTASPQPRRGSYGLHNGDGISAIQPDRKAMNGSWGNTAALNSLHDGHNHPQSGPPPPPPISTYHNSSTQSSYGLGTSRRRSLGGASPPGLYGGSSHDPPPPPPSFNRPHMPPPTSPQQQHNHLSHNTGQRVPFASSFGAGRELPGLGPNHRPGSSMSISSLIGGDLTSSHQPNHTQVSPPSAPATAPSSNHTMQPPSPRRGLSSGSRSEFPQFRQHPSPERHTITNPPTRVSEGHGYSASSPPRAYSSSQGSPDQGRQSLPQTSQPYKPMTFQGSRLYQSSPNDPHARESRQPGSGIPPRPSSQPAAQAAPPEPESKPSFDNGGLRRSVYGHSPEERRRTLGESHHSRPNTSELLGGDPQNTAERERPMTVQPVSHSAFSPPRDHPPNIPTSVPAPVRNNFWRNSMTEDGAREPNQVAREEPTALFRSGFGAHASSSQPAAPFAISTGDDPSRARRVSDHLTNRAVEQYHAPPTSDPNTNERRRAEQFAQALAPGSNTFQSRNYAFDQQQRRLGEDMQPHKSFLGLGPEANRRTGRASPLPQAVQGAQAQPVGPGGDPNIKSEFGRMFSGLGSGLGSGPGISTPSRQSPLPHNGAESLPPDDLRLVRVNSQTGRKSKRVKDEDSMIDSESGDGRGTPQLINSRGPKRSKHNHPGHHHHHHTHAHHHHHHHHKPDDENPPSAPNMTPNASGATFSTLRHNSSLPQNGLAAAQTSHHHHHYHPTPHHHHHAPRTAPPAPLPSPKIITKTHDIQSVLDEAANRPRRHLGSQVYEATVELPKPNSQLDDQFSYASKPKPLPTFDKNPINCTFTIRVPRYYLKPRQRQQIVLQRHLWGARLYRDDSDPIAAAIHSGWIRGEWDETVNVEMLDPRITAANDPSDAEETLVKIPAAPVTPPPDMDLHITVLILPTIEEYFSTCEYGITSRKSVGYSGLSFMIQKMQWVEEGYGVRGQERGAAALKRRLDAGNALVSLMTGERPFRQVNGMAKLHA
ncbi:Rxt3-domain-containing protein [Lepidopterella palustris CBS 459.81]|uniref:Rxt3-domain-containing protein n=1 Tax=Lepidopterella palustris CBS 459.81 TaxID=1314670 RepID=A0A8E2EBR0_9PEZI|nr:Rxt3-domain-containing protein [Lepidopterella palustris CBS 459.81]